MVGGFSSSPYLKGMIKEEFKHTEKHIVNPIEVGSAVCRGALAFGAVDAEVFEWVIHMNIYLRKVVNHTIFFTHDGKGWGLRTLEQLPAGAFVCECVGEILTNMEQEKRNNNAKADPTVTHTYGARRKEALCLDATFFGNAARFINHRCCDGNLVDVPITIESPDRHYYHVSCQQIHLITLALSANT
ncbi:hypothetical protein R1sor_014008 [Riccia sorocarpa]|uniref:SET domain-containing protein n=1 Tax=Riccia sorocarpa TaxID=122646 RepID=A0ABD3HC17_9MARC